MPQLTQTPIWPEILNAATRVKPLHLRQLFAHDAKRFEQMSLSVGELFLDYSKQCLLPETINLLAKCLEQQNFAQQRHALFAGEKVNSSEGRPALHTAMRSSNSQSPHFEIIQNEQNRALDFAEALRHKTIKGATGKIIRNIIHVGIGGSDLGPQLLTTALGDAQAPNIIFIRNVDAGPIAKAMVSLNPEETLLFIASKTFTTAETMLNANTLLAWLGHAMGEKNALRHVVALTASPEKAKQYGVSDAHIFRFWDWVGGRFSIWSSIGLPVMAAMGRAKFTEFLRGAEAMDKHFIAAPPEKNMPVLLAMLSVWNINVLGYTARAVLPYCEALSQWPSYLQQLEMESLGKSVDRDGNAVSYATSPVVFGMTGTPAQHAFMQALHQGTQIIPAEIIIIKNDAV
ncbi:MAG: glucose-6-phosphate isomerase, partial [Alphaproteobacteria bacterium]|nr:glucose-6-phosphate isomerase [Alphaproteobacteria bacterium]